MVFEILIRIGEGVGIMVISYFIFKQLETRFSKKLKRHLEKRFKKKTKK